jgi:NADH-quinone oxidoreductase subunit M
MTQSHLILPMMLAIPLIGAALIFMIKPGSTGQRGRSLGILAFCCALIPSLMGIILLTRFNYARGGVWQQQFFYPWLPQFHVNFSFGVDAISLWLLMLTLLVTPAAILDAVGKIQHRQNEFFAWMLVSYACMIGVFISHDVLLFYLFFEFSLIPTFFILGIWGHSERRKAAIKFFLYAFAGSVLLLASLIYLAFVHQEKFGTFSFALSDLIKAGQSLSSAQQGMVFLGLLIGFAIKVPLFPVHTWMPLAITESPTPGSVMIALVKLGAYGLLRFAIPMLPLAAMRFTPWLAVLCVVSILYGGLISWVQRDMKKLIAYSVLSHLGLCILALLALTMTGLTGCVLVMISSGLLAAAMLMVMGMIYRRYRTRNLLEISGLARRLPVLGFFAVFFFMGTAALPGLIGFVSEIISLVGTYVSGSAGHGGSLGPAYAIPAALGMILGALYMLYWVAHVIFGPLVETTPDTDTAHESHGHTVAHDLSLREWFVLSPLALAVLFIGLYPAPVLQSLQPAIGKIRHEVLAAVQSNTASSMALKTSANSGNHLAGAVRNAGMLAVAAPVTGGSNVTAALRLPVRLAR